MKTEDCKILTEYLGECWHDLAGFGYPIRDDWFALKKSYTHPPKYNKCIHCGKSARFLRDNRTFTSRADMMDLYEAIAKKGEWFDYYYHMFNKFARLMADISKGSTQQDFAAWLFCLNGQGYEERCQMVADWIKEASHEGR